MEKFEPYIAGRQVDLADAAETPLVNPASCEVWGVSPVSRRAAPQAIDAAVEAMESAAWRGLPLQERANAMRRLAQLAEAHAAEFTRLESLVTGKLAKATLGEGAHVAETLNYFAGQADALSGRLVELAPTTEGKVIHEPVGVVVGITPFNGSLSLGIWKVAPALAMGNAIVLKPPSAAPGSSILLATLAAEAGFPPGVLSVVPGEAEVAELLVDDPRVALVSFTGSTGVARKVGARVTGRLGRFVCETGGKSPQIVFADADLDRAADGVSQGIFSNAGQSCIAGSRLLVEESVAEEFLRKLDERVARVRTGEMSDPESTMGPLASERQYARVTGYLERALGEGAELRAQGEVPAGPGYFVAPTVLIDRARSTTAWRTEFFGPVITATTFSEEAEAYAFANDSEFGLAAGVWTRDLARAHRASRALQAGSVWINTYRYMDYRLPFGGYKQSGLGRENGLEALSYFGATKAIVIDHTEG